LPARTLYNLRRGLKIIAMSEPPQNMDFVILVGRAFLRELEAGRRDTAIAFGRAFLLTLGMRGPEETSRSHLGHGKPLNEHPVAA